MYEVPDLYPTLTYRKLEQKQKKEKYFPPATVKDMVAECGSFLFMIFMINFVAVAVFGVVTAIVQASDATMLLGASLVTVSGFSYGFYACYVREIAPYRTKVALEKARQKTPSVSAEAYNLLIELEKLIKELPEAQQQDFAPLWHKAVAAAEWLTTSPESEQAKALLQTRIEALEKVVEKHDLLLETEKALEAQDKAKFAQDYYGTLNDDDLLIAEMHEEALEAYHEKLKSLTSVSMPKILLEKKN